MRRRRIISSVTSDLVSDQRVHRICEALSRESYEVILIGRKKRNSPDLARRPYKVRRLSLWFEKGPLFYAAFNLVLFCRLLFTKADLLIANDLDTLLANALVSRLRGIPLVYDSHEYFTEVPELVDRPLVQRAWKRIEQLCIKVPMAYVTVSPSIARAYAQRYGIHMEVVRNFPGQTNVDKGHLPSEVLIEKGEKKLILYQGSVNVDRGLEEMMEAMDDLPEFMLLICGDGDVYQALLEKRKSLTSADRILFKGRVAMEELAKYTVQADIGISLEKLHGLSYTYALPNKVFDYVQAGIPVLAAPLPEVMALNDEFGFAQVLDVVTPQSISLTLKALFQSENRYSDLCRGAKEAGRELNWEKESKKLTDLISGVIFPS